MDTTAIIVAIFAFLGTTIGSLAGIRASNKLVEHRLMCLEEKVNKHNNLVVRITKAEKDIEFIQEEIDKCF